MRREDLWASNILRFLESSLSLVVVMDLRVSEKAEDIVGVQDP